MKWAVFGLIAAVVLPVAGTFIYLNLLRDEAPERLDTTPALAGTVDPSITLDGTWVVAEGSQVGYRVREILFGQSAEAVGRTSDVEGSFTIEGSAVVEGSFEADLRSVQSDEVRRDRQFHGRIMETDRYPTASFRLTRPLDLSSVQPQQTEGSATATGELTAHGVTNEVTFDLKGVRAGGQIQITGSIPIVFADYNIGNPSGGPAQTEDHGVMEFALNFTKQG
ncbi:MAG TPA: YceI family protein [Actinomycetota bacterium]|nr:YceI family protein [Actinomycetota bacterium]